MFILILFLIGNTVELSILNNFGINTSCKNFKLIRNQPLIGFEYLVEINIDFEPENHIDFKNCLKLEPNFYTFNLIPNKDFLLSDNSLKFNINKIEKRPSVSIKFIRIKVIHFDSNFFTKLRDHFEIIFLEFYYSQFMVRSKNGSNCSLDNKMANFGFFGKLNSVGFGFSTRYFQDTCPLIFSNSVINLVQIYGLSDNFLIRNKLGFVSTNQAINSSIEELEVKAYEMDLDEYLLNEKIFEHVNNLKLNGKIRKVALDQLKQLSSIDIRVNNLIQFIFVNQENFKESSKNKLNNLNIFNNRYKFPNEDFCFLKEFYHFDWIKINIIQNVKCSCTLIVFLRINQNKTNRNFELISSVCGQEEIAKCQIEKAMERCNLSSSLGISQFVSSDLIYNSEFLNYMTLFMTPTFSILNLITNFLNIKIIYNIKLEKRCASNKLMVINSIINLVYSVIYLVHLVNKCVYVNGIFCSSIIREKAVQLFDIVFVEFLLNIFKTWLNVSFIGISWLRLMILIKDNPWVIKTHKFQNEKKFKILLASFLVISVLISLDKFFVVRVNEQHFVMDEKDYEEFPNKNTFMILPLRDLGDHSLSQVHYFGDKATIFFTLFVFNFILTDLLLYLIIFLVDLYILYLFNSKIKYKKKLVSKLKVNEKDGLKNAEFKVNLVVVLNLLFVFVLKLAHFGVSVYIFMKKILPNNDTDNVCFYYSRVCSNYLEFSEQFFILSNAYSFILNFNLNKDFKASFYSILKKNNLSK